MWEDEVSTLLTLALGGNELSDYPAALTCQEQFSWYLFSEGWMDLQDGLEVKAKQKIPASARDILILWLLNRNISIPCIICVQ
jgi:hypothetical protein